MQPYLKKLARHHLDLRKKFEGNGWSEDCNDNDLILRLCEKQMSYKKSTQDSEVHLQIENTYIFDVEKVKRKIAWSKSPILLLPVVLTILIVIYFVLRKYYLFEYV